MGTWSGESKLKPTKLCGHVSGSGATLTVGNTYSGASGAHGSTVNTAIPTNSTDIDNPTWKDLVDLSGGPMLVQLYQQDGFLKLKEEASEASGSPPTRGRGLKPDRLMDSCIVYLVAPYAGAWIETHRLSP